VWLELTLGLVACATWQTEQEELSVGLGWLWVDSTAAVQNIKDRHSQADHRNQSRILLCKPQISCFGIRLFSAYMGYPLQHNVLQVTIEKAFKLSQRTHI